MRNLNEYKKTGLTFTGAVVCVKTDELCINNDEFCVKNDEFCINLVPKFIQVELTREAKHVGQLVDVAVGVADVPIKSWVQELENLRLLYTRLKDEVMEENEAKQLKAKMGLKKYEPDHHGE